MKFLLKKITYFAFAPALLSTTLINSTISDNSIPEPRRIDRPYIISVIDPNGNEIQVASGRSSNITEREILSELGVVTNPEDRVKSFPELKMGIGSKVTLYKAPEFKVRDGKKNLLFRSWGSNIGDLLSEQKIELGQQDKINFSLDSELINGMEIIITRVAKTIVVQNETIDFQTVKKSNGNLEKGNKNIIQKGKTGQKNKFYEVTREGGEEVSRKLIKTEVAKEPIEEIIEVGTKIVTYGNGKATWYKRSQPLVAAHNSLPKGTKVKVVNTSNGKSVVVTIDDRGIKGDALIDLSSDAFSKIADLGSGVVNVRVEKWYSDDN